MRDPTNTAKRRALKEPAEVSSPRSLTPTRPQPKNPGSASEACVTDSAHSTSDCAASTDPVQEFAVFGMGIGVGTGVGGRRNVREIRILQLTWSDAVWIVLLLFLV